MVPTKYFSSTAPPAPKHPRLPTRPEEDRMSNESEIFYRPLTPLSAQTRSSQSTIATQITQKGLLCSFESSIERSSPWRAEFHLPEDHTYNFEVQEEPEAIELLEVEEIVDTSHSDYYDAPEINHEISEEAEDEP